MGGSDSSDTSLRIDDCTDLRRERNGGKEGRRRGGGGKGGGRENRGSKERREGISERVERGKEEGWRDAGTKKVTHIRKIRVEYIRG